MELLFLIEAFFTGRLYILADTYLMSRVYHCLGLHILLLSISYYILHNTPYQCLKKKISWLIFVVYEIFAMATYTICQVRQLDKYTQYEIIDKWGVTKTSSMANICGDFSILQHLFIPTVIVILLYVSFKLSRLDIIYSDKPNLDNILILFRYPKNFTGLILSIFWLYPVSTICLYSGGYKYGFTRKTRTMIKEPIDLADIGKWKYFIKDTGIKKSQYKNVLSSLVGVDWSCTKNCLNVFKPIIGNLNKYF